MKKPEKLIVANDAYFGRSVITERSRRLHEKSGKIIEYYVPAERLEEALEVIREVLDCGFRQPELSDEWYERAREFLAKYPEKSEKD